MVLVGAHLQGWFPFTGLPWNVAPLPCIVAGPPPTFDGNISQAHLLAMSLILPELGVREVSVFSIASKVALLWGSKEAKNNHKKLQVQLRIAPKPVQAETTHQYCFDFNLTYISFSHFLFY